MTCGRWATGGRRRWAGPVSAPLRQARAAHRRGALLETAHAFPPSAPAAPLHLLHGKGPVGERILHVQFEEGGASRELGRQPPQRGRRLAARCAPGRDPVHHGCAAVGQLVKCGLQLAGASLHLQHRAGCRQPRAATAGATGQLCLLLRNVFVLIIVQQLIQRGPGLKGVG